MCKILRGIEAEIKTKTQKKLGEKGGRARRGTEGVERERGQSKVSRSSYEGLWF